MRKYLLFGSVAFIVALVDQLTKVYIHGAFNLHESIEVVPGFFNLTYVRNPGAAFGLLAKNDPAFRELFFLSMPAIAVTVILMILRGVRSSEQWLVISLALICGGAIGNYIDRIRFRFVVDFLDFHFYRKHTWPAFNTADIAIVTGVSIMMFLEFSKNRSRAESSRQKL